MRDTDQQAERQTDQQTERQRQRQRQRQRNRDRETETEKQRQRNREVVDHSISFVLAALERNDTKFLEASFFLEPCLSLASSTSAAINKRSYMSFSPRLTAVLCVCKKGWKELCLL